MRENEHFSQNQKSKLKVSDQKKHQIKPMIKVRQKQKGFIQNRGNNNCFELCGFGYLRKIFKRKNVSENFITLL